MIESRKPDHISYDKFLLPLHQFNLQITADSAILFYTRVPELTGWGKNGTGTGTGIFRVKAGWESGQKVLIRAFTLLCG